MLQILPTVNATGPTVERGLLTAVLMLILLLIVGFPGQQLASTIYDDDDGWWVIRRILRRVEPQLTPTLRFRPGSLLVVLAAVVVGRLVQFEPGMVFGMIAA